MKNHRKYIFNLIILGFVFIGCKSKPGQVASMAEGTIVYKITYPDSLNYGIKAAFFPKEIVLVFKNEKAAFIASGGMGMIQLVNILDHEKQTYTSLLIDQLRQNFGCKLTPDEIKKNENSAHLKITPVEENKTIAGIQCKKAVVEDLGTQTNTNAFYDEAIHFSYGNSPLKEMNFLLLEYTHTINNLTMKLEATNVDLKTPVDTSLFTIKGEYVWVTQQQLFDHLNKL